MEKEEKKHDHGSEKKHGGLLGLFHREKPDPQLKEDEARRQAQLSGNAGTGTGSLPPILGHDTGLTSSEGLVTLTLAPESCLLTSWCSIGLC